MIIISTQCFAPSTGGIESVMYSLASQLKVLTKDVCVFADHSNQVNEREFDLTSGLEIRRYTGIKPLRRRKKAADILKFIITRGDPSVLLADTWKSIEFIGQTPLAKIVCLAHGSEVPKQPTPTKLSRIARAFSKANLIIANSNYTAGLVGPYLSNQHQLKVISPGIQRPETSPALEEQIKQQLEPRHPILISVARLDTRKNHQAVIKSLPALIQLSPNLLYVIIGDGPQQKELQTLAAKLNVLNYVLFTGRLEGAAKHAYLANSDLFVLPGTVVGDDVEGFGLAYIEAGYFGLPCIASDAGGAAEAVIHNKTGLICKSGDQDHLQKNIAELLTSPIKRQLMGEQGKIRAMDFLWEKKICEYAGQLNDMAVVKP